MARQGGEIALDLIEDSSPTLKPDNSVLTQADTEISLLIREELKDMLETGEHILIDEEEKDYTKVFDQSFLESASYTWVVDPIDGTRNFSNRIPLYGISIGLLRDLKPWLGLVYLPSLGEMFFSDGKGSFFVTGAFSGKERRRPVLPVDQPISPQSVFYGSDTFFKDYEWDSSLCQMVLPSCAVVHLCWPAIGRGCGYFFKANIWDFAGSWPVFLSAGLGLRSLSSGKPLDRIDTRLFMGRGAETWRLREPYILSSEGNFSRLQAAISSKP